MKNITEYKVILWDFDGVIMDSMPIRGKGFEEVLKEFPREQVEQLLAFHEHNGGLSRYVKFKYFFEEIRGEAITNEQVLEMADRFSKIMLALLIDEKLLIDDSVNFIKNNWMNHDMYIVSGSDGKELNTICKELNLSKYFRTINGSPTPKVTLVKDILTNYSYTLDEVILIGDSINDLDASTANGITFFAFNNKDLLTYTSNYIDSFSEF